MVIRSFIRNFAPQKVQTMIEQLSCIEFENARADVLCFDNGTEVKEYHAMIHVSAKPLTYAQQLEAVMNAYHGLLDRLPDDASETIRLVRIGDYDVCPCIGKHVRSTLQIGRFELLGTNWDEKERSFRVRFKIV